MRSLPMIVLMLLSAVAAAEEATRADLTVRVEVSPVGEVMSVELPASLHRSLADRLRSEMGGWRFATCEDDEASKREVELGLSAHEADGGVAMRIDYVNAGVRVLPDTRGHTPRYPSGALQHGVEGVVSVRLRLGNEGAVVDAHAARSGVGGVRMSDARQRYWREQFERAVLAAVRHWRFDPAIVPPGTTVGYQVSFQAGEADRNHWRTYTYGAETAPPWPVEKAVDASELLAGDCSRLLTHVVGRTF